MSKKKFFWLSENLKILVIGKKIISPDLIENEKMVEFFFVYLVIFFWCLIFGAKFETFF